MQQSFFLVISYLGSTYVFIVANWCLKSSCLICSWQIRNSRTQCLQCYPRVMFHTIHITYTFKGTKHPKSLSITSSDLIGKSKRRSLTFIFRRQRDKLSRSDTLSSRNVFRSSPNPSRGNFFMAYWYRCAASFTFPFWGSKGIVLTNTMFSNRLPVTISKLLFITQSSAFSCHNFH